MSLIKEKYSDKRVNLIYQILLNEKEAGNTKDYDIRIDDLKVVSRTNDTERFFDHEDFIQDDTKNVTFCLYDGNSRRSTRYVLLLKEEESTEQKTLAGIEKSIDEKMSQARKTWEYEQLQKENEELRQQLDESEDYADILKTKVDEFEMEKNNSSSKLTNTLINLAGVYIAKNPNALDGIPLLGDLAGNGRKQLNESKVSNKTDNSEEGHASFQKQKVKSHTGQITQEDLEDLHKALIPFYNEENIAKVDDILAHLYQNSGYIDHVLTGLENATLQSEKTKQAA